MDFIAVAKLVVVRREQKTLLLIKRSATDSRRPGQWDLPGGQVKHGELLEEGAVRECQEETGLIVHPKDLKLFMTLNGTVGEGSVWVNWLFFAVAAPEGELRLSYEHDAGEWCGLDEALKRIQYDRHRQVLRQIKECSLLNDWL